MTDHKPLPVHGYTEQSQERVDLVNAGKELEERVLRYLDGLEAMAAAIPAADGKARGEALRCAATGRTQIQSGFMWAFRSVFGPQRTKLQGD